MPQTPRIIGTLNTTMARYLGPDIGYATDEEAVLATLNLVESRECYGPMLFEAWTSRLADQLAETSKRLDLAKASPALDAELQRLRTEVMASKPTDMVSRDAEEQRLLSAWADLAERITGSPALPHEERLSVLRDVTSAERQRTVELMGGDRPKPAEEDIEINRERLEIYLRDRFGDTGLKVASFKALPGGYGKETTLFEVDGAKLSGGFVMRRDRLKPTMDNDCHHIDREYRVIRAAYENGFPAPEALWLDTEHRLLPGGNFLVMSRAPGTSGGDVFSASGALSADFADLLASNLAKLHALPPMPELGSVSEMIAPDLWNLTCAEAAERYIRQIRDLYLSEMSVPSPAVLSFYGYLLANIPDAPERAVLLHGDVGFHNMIVDEGRLSALVDWEFSHIGDPAEDVGYACNTAGSSLDWDRFMATYRASGGIDISPERLRFFRIWGHLRNLTACQMTSNAYDQGRVHDLKLAHVGHSMTPMFLDAISAVIAESA
ncbi:MAG TPA: phosphotransferase family protein [Sphingomonas sp.]|nr:phosphotransferase family protein [Sphingomonas sp.]